MDLFTCGRKGTIFGVPIAGALCFSVFVHFYSISELVSLIARSHINFHSLGTLDSPSFDFPRVYLLVKMATSLLWGAIILLNVAIFRRSILLAYVTLGFAHLFYGELFCGLIYGIWAFFREQYLEQRYAMRTGGFTNRYWLSLAGNVFFHTIIASIVFDMHWSYVMILAHKGNGWESKAYFEIHQSEGETVATLQAQWDARMGLQGKGPGRTLRQDQLPKQRDEKTPLFTDVVT